MVTELRNVSKHINNLETVRNQDMREIKDLLQRTSDVRVLDEVRRVTQILDGDPRLGLKGMRDLVQQNVNDVGKLTTLRDKILWIAIGVIIASGGAGALIGQLVRSAVSP